MKEGPLTFLPSWGAGLRKYGTIGRLSVKNQLIYVLDVFIRSLFLLAILYIFVQLWTVTYDGVGQPSIAGYRFEELIWYLVFSESIIMATPRLHLKVEDEVKSGGIAYLITRPMSYLLYHYAEFAGEFMVRLVVNMLVGGILGLCLFGFPSFGFGWAGFWPAVLGSLTVNYLIRMILSLCAFWVEETQGLVFVYDKLLFTIGGMMLPLELFPEGLQKVCAWLPFQTVIYFPVKTIVQFDGPRLGSMLAVQSGWTLVLGLVLAYVFRKGVKKLNVNGG